MDDLVQFLRDRLDEDEAGAKAANGILEWHSPAARVVMAAGFDEAEPYDTSLKEILERDDSMMPFGAVAVTDYDADAKFIARHDPARVLAEVEAKRQILRALKSSEVALRNTEPGKEPHDLVKEATNGLRATARALAAVYADRTDYREEWRP